MTNQRAWPVRIYPTQEPLVLYHCRNMARLNEKNALCMEQLKSGHS
jgi:hypothetical protein